MKFRDMMDWQRNESHTMAEERERKNQDSDDKENLDSLPAPSGAIGENTKHAQKTCRFTFFSSEGPVTFKGIGCRM
jgi:hypothetical protein